MTPIKEILNEIYLEWFNNYATVEKMAEHHGLDPDDLQKLLDLGRKINNGEYKIIY